MAEIKTFRLPDLGEGLTEAELVTWTVAVGDAVQLNQIIAEVETAKATVELPSPFAGTVRSIHVQAGETAAVGGPLIDIEISAGKTDSHPDRPPLLVGYGVADEDVERRRRRVERPVHNEAISEERQLRALASPPVRFAARQLGIQLADVPASGDRGEVTRADLDRYAEKHTAGTELDASPNTRGMSSSEETRTPIKGVRKHTAAAMVASAFTAPHVTEFLTVDVTPSLELLDALRAHEAFADIRLTPLVLVANAVLAALRSNPILNSAWNEADQEIITKHYVNLGVAAATPRGLVVPNIKGADGLSLRELAVSLNDLTATAKQGRTRPDALVGGTITISNIGVFGIDAGTPIINPGEASILAFGAIRRQPWEHHGDIELRSVTTLSLSFDHRIVDGEQGSKFLRTIGEILTTPLTLIALS